MARGGHGRIAGAVRSDFSELKMERLGQIGEKQRLSEISAIQVRGNCFSIV
jgi:hypothetical protein